MIGLHVSPVEFLTTSCYVVIFAFFWRYLAARWADKPVGQAMAYIL